MNGRKSKLLRTIAVRNATEPADLGYVQRKVKYKGVDRHGRPVTKEKKVIQLRYKPMSWRPIHRRLKRAYTRNPEIRAKFAGVHA